MFVFNKVSENLTILSYFSLQIHDIQHFNDMIIAITDKQGSKEFRMEIEGTVLEAATKALIVVVVD